ncbi:hypothetical protein A3F02_03705 [Candidatus Curtissbacteria bacterium RIFCSPHIGHO2_12_FULL_38_9b]|uniref:Mur ligase central domain-containing protein n=2 Tax=Candidatus Curtissiibacteriota TaxID=1752717 RepID=A0A1F5H0D4_9BACT|nr:MAG: hypothetical protein A3A48_01575 [Candidatus Curtissbacteria bacterium RIFCSPLOWO2_01_FULL_37_9]OGD97561.1 MAG: hypothetical protein A3F02_03705 [Candidatus Curtissbacteria bacterium RIFCSPHIGHO2_12_FULL_38_9b]
MFTNYIEVREWLESYIPQVWTKKELGLERIKYLLLLLGNPQNSFKSIHIAGTSGKGSTAFYLARLLASSQFKVQSSKSKKSVNRQQTTDNLKIGLHISPHLVDIRERMQIFKSGKWRVESGKSDEKLMTMNRFIRLFNEIKPVVEKIKEEKPKLTPSYFEILVAASFLYFAKEKVDWAVVEVGLGGRLDATNVLSPKLSVITNVGLDHTDILGTKVETIAKEKAGIIKSGVPVVTGCPSASSGSSTLRFPSEFPTNGKALKVIEKVAKEKKAKLIKVNTQLGVRPLKVDAFGVVAKYIDIFRYNVDSFTTSNKLLALAAVRTLGIPLKKNQIIKAFGSTFPGRFEEIQKDVILDGAHNADKVRSLIEFVRNSNPETRNSKQIQKSKIQNPKSIILVITFKKGKDWKKMVDLLIKNLPVSKVIATKFYAVTDMGRYAAVEPKEIADYVSSIKYKVLSIKTFENSHEAVFEALQSTVNREPSTILITGSLYLVGEARTMWKLPEY